MTKIAEFPKRFENINYHQLTDTELENYFSEFSERLSECAYHIALRSYKRRNMDFSVTALSKGRTLKNEYLHQVSDHDLSEYHNFLILESSKIRWIMASRTKIRIHSSRLAPNT